MKEKEVNEATGSVFIFAKISRKLRQALFNEKNEGLRGGLNPLKFYGAGGRNPFTSSGQTHRYGVITRSEESPPEVSKKMINLLGYGLILKGNWVDYFSGIEEVPDAMLLPFRF